MERNSNKGIIWILAILLIIVTVLYVKELKKPASLESFNEELAAARQEVTVACADNTTDENRSACVDALEKVNNLVGTIKE